jgi:membrane associated rhomboid family serine protease
MSEAPVGFHCPVCVREGQQSQRRPTTLVGGRPTPGTPVVTYTLIALCTVMLLLERTYPQLTTDLGMIGEGGGGIGVAHGQVWRLLTAALLHENLIHLTFNMVALWFVGSVLEPLLGRSRFAALFVISALGGSTGSMLAHPVNVLSVGASGAVFGLFGAYFVLARRLNRDTGQIVGLIVINALLGFVIPNIDWQAHLGGLIVGALFTAVLLFAPKIRRTTFQAVGGTLLVCACLALVAVRSMTLG